MQGAVAFVDTHLAACKAAAVEGHNPDDVEDGRPAAPFSRDLAGVDLAVMPEAPLKRSDVFGFAQNSRVSTLTVCAAIMAWGGMRTNHRDMFFDNAERGWLPVAHDMRNGMIGPVEAYDRLYALRTTGKLSGAGPAYYTKLIYFLTPRDSSKRSGAYIMDQWVGSSVNVLVGRELVWMNISRTWGRKHGVVSPSYNFIVADANTAANYETFCSALDDLSSHLNLDPDHLDRTLTSKGGRNPEGWRKYVIEQRPCLVGIGIEH